jgi:tRNA(Ile)-lysidine synthase
MDGQSPKTTYVVAVSGGVDSVSLLDILVTQFADARLVVAHFDHGIRVDSAEDRKFVNDVARAYNLPFIFDNGNLGAGASEAKAREARYNFLRRVKDISDARAIVTAHHEDDVLETAILNLLRGTGRKGLSSLQSTSDIYRPLLDTSKANLQKYAAGNGLKWREDPSNQSQEYLRNYIRHTILPRFDADSRQKLKNLIEETRGKNVQIDAMIADQLHLQPATDTLDRHWFIMLPHAVAHEIIASWLRGRGIRDFDTKLLERLVIAAKTFAPGKLVDVDKTYQVKIAKDSLNLSSRKQNNS